MLQYCSGIDSIANTFSSITLSIAINTSVIDSHIENNKKIGTVNLVLEHIVTTPKCSATKFTVLIFAVFDVYI